MDPVEITADGLLLRPWRAEDADAVHEACQDPDIQRWTSVPQPYERHHAIAFVSEHSPDAWNDRSAAPLGVFDKSSGELLGANGLTWWQGAQAEVGFWIAPSARGRGVGTKATRAVAQWATEVVGIERLQWRAELGNHASRLIALRVGVVIEGVQRATIATPDRGLVDGWIGAVGPGQVTTVTPDHLGTGSVAARRAAVFSAAQPSLPLDGAPGTLRPVGAADIPAIVETCSDKVAVRWTSLPTPYKTEHAEGYVRDIAVGGWLRGDRPAFAIADPDGTLCGLIDLSISAADPETAEIGYVVAPWARGRGLARAAARTIAAWGFSALGLARIEWRAFVGNDTSRRIAEQCGFTVEGTLRAAGRQRSERRDVWIATRLASDGA